MFLMGRRYAVLVFSALIIASGCGGSPSFATVSNVEDAFRQEGFDLMNSNLFGSTNAEDEVLALYSALELESTLGETAFLVAVFVDEEAAQRYSIPQASPLADGGEIDRVNNTVVYFRQDVTQTTFDAAERALARL